MWQTWFERLFKFKEVNFSEGDIVLQLGNALYLVLPLLLLCLAGFIAIYFVTNIYVSSKSRAISLSLKLVALLLLFIPLFEPTLMTPDVIPNESFVVVMVDRSNSMGIEDGTFGNNRIDDVQHILNNPESGILKDLREDFKLRFYEFSNESFRTDSVSGLIDGTETNFTNSLEKVISDFKGLPLAGILVFSDGGDNSLDDPTNVVEELRTMNVPLHIVGVGSETFTDEREILDVTAGKGLKQGTGAEIDVKLRSWADDPAPVEVNLFSGEELVHSETKVLKGDGRTDYFSFFYEPENDDPTEYTVKLDVLDKEINTENNEQNILINTQRDSIRVLYFEGHLRNEFKYIKRALEDDLVVEFTSVTRTGTGKYFRQGIKNVNELSGGFPVTEEELNEFKAVIFGDVEASYFTLDQLRMVEEFVRTRGGGLLMLGGLNSFAEGNYWNTPIADLLPVELDPSRKQAIPAVFHNPNVSIEEQGGYKFVPTREGLENPILKLASDIGTNRAMWDEMPKLTSINFLGAPKPGAVVLAKKEKDDYGPEEPLLLIHRYGKGRAGALATAGTWRWQMQREVEDTRHERFWRQLVRWLVTSAPDNVNLTLSETVYSPGENVTMRVSVFDDDYEPQDFVDVKGTITDPYGKEIEVNFRADLTENGVYLSNFIPQDEGVYKIDVKGTLNGKTLGTKNQNFLTRPSKQEFFDATLKKRFLRNLTEANGGIYYDIGDVANVPANLKTLKTSTSIYKSEYLWDMPIIFFLVLLILSIEWIYRRRKGLP